MMFHIMIYFQHIHHFLNEGQEGGGAITNAAAIKKVSVKVMFNRPYDEILLLYSTSPTGPVKALKAMLG